MEYDAYCFLCKADLQILEWVSWFILRKMLTTVLLSIFRGPTYYCEYNEKPILLHLVMCKRS